MKSAQSKKLNFLFIVILFGLNLIVPLILKVDPLNFWLVAAGAILIFIFSFWHSLLKFGRKNSLIFLAIALVVSYLAEIFGVKWGHFLNGGYNYPEFLGLRIFGIPILVSLMWVSIIYISYQVAEHLTDFRFSKNLSFLKKTISGAAVALLTGLAAVAWDLVIDPLAAQAGWWKWNIAESDFSFFNVPIGNFIGWIVVVFIIVFIFKLFFEKEKAVTEDLFEFSPLISYGLLWLNAFAWSVQFGRAELAVVSVITMWPFIITLIIRFLVKYFKLPKQYK